MEFEKLIELIKTVSDSSLSEFQYEEETYKIKMKAGSKGGQMIVSGSDFAAPVAMQAAPIAAAAPAAVAAAEEKPALPSGNVVKSPLVGTFYSAASPEDAPFVKVGDKVSKGQTLGIVEAMKLMNDIECEFDGEIVEILVENEDVVEYGQPLFVVK